MPVSDSIYGGRLLKVNAALAELHTTLTFYSAVSIDMHNKGISQ